MLHIHTWKTILGSGLGRAHAMRYCTQKGCSLRQTLMYEITREKEVWVDGNFFEDPLSPVFIVAEDQEALKLAVRSLPDTAGYFQVKDPADLEAMRKYRHPRFILGKDWKETGISDLDEFRLLLMTGHF